MVHSLTNKEEEDRAIRMALDMANEIRNSWTIADIRDLVERFNTIGGLGEAIRTLKKKGFEKQISQIPRGHLEIAIESLIDELKGI